MGIQIIKIKKIFIRLVSAGLSVVVIFSLVLYAFPGQAIAVTPTVIFLTDTSATTWTVPSDWNNSNNTIEVIGGGGGGLKGNSGGGGGAYSKISNATLTKGSSVAIKVGSAGVAETSAGGDSYLCNSTSNCSNITGSAVIVGAKGGSLGTLGGGDIGGQSSSGVGDIKYLGGGTTGPISCGAVTLSGGGGAAGPNGGGGWGGASSFGNCDGANGGGGGGGNGGGSDGQQPQSSFDGGNGGNNFSGNGGGAGGGFATDGSAGTNGGGGGGAGLTSTNGGASGGAGTEWDASHGSGGGGGSSADKNGGGGALYGAGGGNTVNGSTSGSGAQGIIVITYAPIQKTRINAPTNFLALNTGLVGWWTLDGQDTNWTANTTADKSGNGNTGTLVNMSTTTSPVIGKIGQGLYLNGPAHNSAVYVSVEPSTPLQLQGGEATFSLWLKPVINSWPSNYTSLIAKRDGVHDNYEVYLEVGTGKLGFYNGSLFTSSYVVPTGIWTYVTVTISGSVCSFYANGSFLTSLSSCSIGTAATSNTLIGYYDAGLSDQQQFDGSLDDVRIYSRALSASEVQQLYTVTSGSHIAASNSGPNNLNQGLVGWWTLDGQDTNWTTNTTADKSGNSRTGTLVNMSTTTSPVLGKIGQGLTFNGSNTRITTGSEFIGTGAITISAWVKPNNDVNTIGSRIMANGKTAFVFSGTPRALMFTSDGSVTTVNSAQSITYNAWNFVVVTRDASGVANFYVNGQLSGTANQNSGTPVAGNSNVTIGTNSGFTLTMDGVLDDIRLYNRVLSSSEVRQLYNLGR